MEIFLSGSDLWDPSSNIIFYTFDRQAVGATGFMTEYGMTTT